MCLASILSQGDTRVNPTDKEGPSSLWDDIASFMQSYFSPTFSGFFSCPQFSATENIYSVFQLLVWNLLLINRFVSEAWKGIVHTQSVRSGGQKVPAGYLNSALRYTSMTYIVLGSSPRMCWSCPQLPNGIKTHIKRVITDKFLKSYRDRAERFLELNHFYLGSFT